MCISWVEPKWLEYQWVNIRLRQFSVLKLEGGEHRLITIPPHSPPLTTQKMRICSLYFGVGLPQTHSDTYWGGYRVVIYSPIPRLRRLQSNLLPPPFPTPWSRSRRNDRKLFTIPAPPPSIVWGECLTRSQQRVGQGEVSRHPWPQMLRRWGVGRGVSGGRGAERGGQAEVRGRRLKIEFSARISTKIEQPR